MCKFFLRKMSLFTFSGERQLLSAVIRSPAVHHHSKCAVYFLSASRIWCKLFFFLNGVFDWGLRRVLWFFHIFVVTAEMLCHIRCVACGGIWHSHTVESTNSMRLTYDPSRALTLIMYREAKIFPHFRPVWSGRVFQLFSGDRLILGVVVCWRSGHGELNSLCIAL